MFTEYELLEAIDQCQNDMPKTFSTAEKMAVFYTILDHLRADDSYKMSRDPAPALAPKEEQVIGDYGTSEFFLAISGKESGKIWSVFGELMDALKVLNPKLYSRTIERLTAVE